MGQKTFSKKAKELLKKVKDIAATGALTTGGEGWKKKKKEKEYVVDPNATVGGTRIRGVKGPEIKPFKIKKIKQEPLPKNIRPKGLGAALRGGGRAFNKGGKV